MSSTRTQIYLTARQRAELDAVGRRDRKTMAQLVREAVDAYLEGRISDPEESLAATFGSLPDLVVPSRDEWDRA